MAKVFFRIASVGLILVNCSSAWAADEGGPIDWSGSYLGAHLSVGSLDTKFHADFGLLSPDSYNATLKTGGVHFGYGRQLGAWYAGLEGSWGFYGGSTVQDLSTSAAGGLVGSPGGAVGGGVFGNSDGSNFGAPGSVIGGGVGGVRPDVRWIDTKSAEAFETKLHSVGSLRARLGYPTGRVLPFISAGLAAGDIETRYVAGMTRRLMRGSVVIHETSEGIAVDDRKFMVGYALGGGLEYSVTPRLSVRGEYAFTDLGHRIYTYADGSEAVSFKSRLHEARVGFTYRF